MSMLGYPRVSLSLKHTPSPQGVPMPPAPEGAFGPCEKLIFQQPWWLVTMVGHMI